MTWGEKKRFKSANSSSRERSRSGKKQDLARQAEQTALFDAKKALFDSERQFANAQQVADLTTKKQLADAAIAHVKLLVHAAQEITRSIRWLAKGA